MLIFASSIIGEVTFYITGRTVTNPTTVWTTLAGSISEVLCLFPGSLERSIDSCCPQISRWVEDP
jgi:hypothetical protein